MAFRVRERCLTMVAVAVLVASACAALADDGTEARVSPSYAAFRKWCDATFPDNGGYKSTPGHIVCYLSKSGTSRILFHRGDWGDARTRMLLSPPPQGLGLVNDLPTSAVSSSWDNFDGTFLIDACASWLRGDWRCEVDLVEMFPRDQLYRAGHHEAVLLREALKHARSLDKAAFLDPPPAADEGPPPTLEGWGDLSMDPDTRGVQERFAAWAEAELPDPHGVFLHGGASSTLVEGDGPDSVQGDVVCVRTRDRGSAAQRVADSAQGEQIEVAGCPARLRAGSVDRYDLYGYEVRLRWAHGSWDGTVVLSEWERGGRERELDGAAYLPRLRARALELAESMHPAVLASAPISDTATPVADDDLPAIFSHVFLIDRSQCMSDGDRLRRSLSAVVQCIRQIHALNRVYAARDWRTDGPDVQAGLVPDAIRKHGPDGAFVLTEWSVMAFDGTDLLRLHDFTTDPWETHDAAAKLMALQDREPPALAATAEARKQRVERLVWAITTALVDAYTSGDGMKVALSFLSCAGDPADARWKALNKGLRDVLLNRTKGQDTAHINAPSGLWSLPWALMGQPSPEPIGGTATLEDALAELERRVNESGNPFSVSTMGVDVEAGSEAEEALKLLAESADGRYYPSRTDPEFLAAIKGITDALSGDTPDGGGPRRSVVPDVPDPPDQPGPTPGPGAADTPGPIAGTPVHRQITSLDTSPYCHNGQQPVLSADGSTVAFALPDDGVTRIMAMDFDGSGLREVDAYEPMLRAGSTIALSADGSVVASTEGRQIRVADARGARQLFVCKEIGTICLDAAGDHVYFVISKDASADGFDDKFDRGIYSFRIADGSVNRVLNIGSIAGALDLPPEDVPRLSSDTRSPRLGVSADGRRIVLIAQTRAARDPESVITCDLEQRLCYRITAPTDNMGGVCVSADGTTIAFVVPDGGEKLGYVADFDGGNARALTGAAAVGEMIGLTASGSHALFGSEGRLLPADGSNGVSLAPEEGDRLWLTTVAGDGRRFLYVAKDEAGIPQLHTIELPGGGARRAPPGGGAPVRGPEAGSASPAGAEDLIVCADMRDGTPVGASDSFRSPTQLCVAFTYRDLPDDSRILILWRRSAERIARQWLDVSGSGTATVCLVADEADGGFTPGKYEVIARRKDTNLARRRFAIEP